MAKLKESYQAKQDDDQRKSTVQKMQKSTDFSRRIIVCFIATDIRVKITSGGSRRGT